MASQEMNNHRFVNLFAIEREEWMNEIGCIGE